MTFAWGEPIAERASSAPPLPIAGEHWDRRPQAVAARAADVGRERLAPGCAPGCAGGGWPDGERLGRPVRIGSVMIRLLRGYGITDQEISEGLARYAAAHRCAQAG